MENFSRTILLIVAGILSVNDGAATAFLLSYTRTFMFIGLGLQQSAKTTVGRNLGSGNVPQAKSFYYSHFKVGLSVMLLYFILLELFTPYLIDLFTKNAKLKEICLNMMFWVNVVVASQNIRGILNGAQIAMGL